jgi:hypothetical protein
MRLFFFSFKHRYRQKELNNLLNTRIYGKYFILNLSGPFKYFVGKILLFLRIGKAISCDARPLIPDKTKGINLWMRGTNLDIPNDLKKLNNNFVTIDNPFIQNQKIFRLYPINIKKTKIQDNLKIIHMSRINIDTSAEEKNIWNKYKDQLIEDFTLVDNNDFLKKISLNHNDEMRMFNLYKKIKLLLRFEIIENLKKVFNNKINLIGDGWDTFHSDSLTPIYNMKKITKMYKGNIGLDLGSLAGSISLYPRSIQIIESGGLIIQSTQKDSNKVWKNLHDKILFNNISGLISLVEKLLNNKQYCLTLLQEISENFRHSDRSIENNLDKIINILN